MKKTFSLLLLIGLSGAVPGWAAIERARFQAGERTLVVEVWADDLLHVGYYEGEAPAGALPVTEMIARTDYDGPTEYTVTNRRLETRDLFIEVDPRTLAFTLHERRPGNRRLTQIAPYSVGDTLRGLRASRPTDFRAYGLGQQFDNPGSVRSDYAGRVREGGEFGNEMIGFNYGANGNTQIPIFYALQEGGRANYAVFFDNTYRHRWDFTNANHWEVSTTGGDVRAFVMTGPDLPHLRRNYLQLTGLPPVPPRAMFGLWVSEYGYDDWAEMEDKLRTLRQHQFPLDGFVLDLQWFGNIAPESEDTQIGRLAWDYRKFPNPAQKLRTLRDEQGVGIMLIEETYVGRNLPEYEQYKAAGLLVQAPASSVGGGPEGVSPTQDGPGSNRPAGEQVVASARQTTGADTLTTYILQKKWWGSGGMLDYSNPRTGPYIFENKRLALIEDGVVGHWTDLGEPENYNPAGQYAAGTHADVHNLYNFHWIRSIYEGYQQASLAQRPFIMSRSGTAGIQRFGAAMWSGDISGRLTSLAAHAANQANMSLSGIDYYGADLGGFHRNLEAGADLDDLYTRWYAYGMWFDVPGRPHTVNIEPTKTGERPTETAPDRVGDRASNLRNTRQRYALIPYLYSLAHEAYRTGEPVMPPLIYYYQTDTAVAHLGDQKMIGPYLMAKAVLEYNTQTTDVYLPAGDWYDWYTHERITSTGTVQNAVPLFGEGKFQLPAFARAGAIVPLMAVDSATLNAASMDKPQQPLLVRVYRGGAASEFTLYEDDGRTTAYERGAVRRTHLSQMPDGRAHEIRVAGAEGDYQMDAQRALHIVFVADARARRIRHNGTRLRRYKSVAALEAQTAAGWAHDAAGTIVIRTPPEAIKRAARFRVEF